MNVDRLKARLSSIGLPDIRYFSSTGSTNDVSLEWAKDGAADRALVVADYQSQGRGRMGRTWITQPGSALAVSLILRPSSKDARHLTLYALLASLALSQVLIQTYQLEAKIKWPNDVLLRNKKVAGILVEAAWIGDQIQGIIIGIGVNVLHGSLPPVEALNFPATSIEAELEHPVERLDVLTGLLQEMFHLRNQMNSPEFLKNYEALLAYKGEQVQVQAANGSRLSGRVLGLNPEGSLRILSANGDVITVQAGDVHLRSETP